MATRPLHERMSTRAEQTNLYGDIKVDRPGANTVINPTAPVWTSNKAKLIAKYVRFFMLVTKHGTYIDGFAGPQTEADGEELWSAKLVLGIQPRWLTDFFLFDVSAEQCRRLREMVATRPPSDRKRGEKPQNIRVIEGDCNERIAGLLKSGQIPTKHAAFALLDQRTFECRWETVNALAQHKTKGDRKIELFYFLPTGWLDRALAATKSDCTVSDWWGTDDLKPLYEKRGMERAEFLANRMRIELGYQFATPWPVYEGPRSRRVMYHMIHATDHPEAPQLMSRAYRQTVDPVPQDIQTEVLELTAFLTRLQDVQPPRT
jgi:three-Cys-motif partner protein